MGIICKMFDHKLEAIDFWGDEAEYILFKCKRCNHEEIYCSYEGKVLPNDAFGKEIMNKMMSDVEFSKACHIHTEFLKAEHYNPFNFKKQEQEYERLRKEFDIKSKVRPACPIEMYKAGLWKSKKGKKPTKSKIEGETSINLTKGEQEEYPNDFKSKSHKNYNKKTKVNIPVQDRIKELEKLEKIYANDENYEKAAQMRNKISKLRAETK